MKKRLILKNSLNQFAVIAPPNPKCLTAIIVFDIWARSPISQLTRHGFCSILGENTAFVLLRLCEILVCQKQLLMSSIWNLCGRELLEIPVILYSYYIDINPYIAIILWNLSIIKESI